MLDAQATGLLRGDEEEFLADIDPTRADVIARSRDLYVTLRGLLVSGWHATVSDVDGNRPLRVPEQPVDVTVGYCLGTTHCSTTMADAGSVARTTIRMSFAVASNRIVITGLDPAGGTVRPRLGSATGTGSQGTAPWQMSALRVRSGHRTVVAAPPEWQHRLPLALAAAEAAARVADQYALWAMPERYYVYFAGPAQWGTWYGVPGDVDAGLAVPTSPRSMDIVVNAAAVPDSALESLLRKEMGSVVALLGTNPRAASDAGAQWVAEGYSGLVRYTGEPSAVQAALASLLAYLPSVPSLDAFLDRGRPTDPPTFAAFSEASYLALTYISYRFGMVALFRLVEAVLREHVSVPNATAIVLGVYWPDFKAEFWSIITLR